LERLFVMHSANAPREAPEVFRRYWRGTDLVRIESLEVEDPIPRRNRYVLPTTLRRRWAGEPGLRHWMDRGCGPSTPNLVVYDPERWSLTPVSEQEAFVQSVREAASTVRSSGCHEFGIAPGPDLLFGLDASSCRVELSAGAYRRIPWKRVDVVDIQAQRLLGDACFEREGIEGYVEAVRTMADYVRMRNPDIEVVAQLSFRDTPPARMRTALALVAGSLDGVFYSYPSTHPHTPCRYCSPRNLLELLRSVRGEETAMPSRMGKGDRSDVPIYSGDRAGKEGGF
jgi:hypothetical protein